MKDYLPSGAIHVYDVRLWAHVGVLEKERIYGQIFSLNFSLWLDLDLAAKNDNLLSSADYGLAIVDLQQLSLQLNCLTLEHFSDLILQRLQELYGPVPMKILLRKCNPPVPGFSGSVVVERRKNFPSASG